MRKFIETVNIDDNEGKPLNEGGHLKYVVVTTHCHYDHILAVEDFPGSPVLASSYSPSFLSPENIGTNSLCNDLGIPTPSYTPTLVPHLHNIHDVQGDVNLDVLVLHTPGHTPDELALYDPAEKMLYVGDSLYEYDHIIFPKEGSIIAWFSTVDYLVSFVQSQSSPIGKSTHGCYSSGTENDVWINAGHQTVCRPALEVLLATRAFMKDVVEGKEALVSRTIKRGEETVEYRQKGGHFALICPERLVLEARQGYESIG